MLCGRRVSHRWNFYILSTLILQGRNGYIHTTQKTHQRNYFSAVYSFSLYKTAKSDFLFRNSQLTTFLYNKRWKY